MANRSAKKDQQKTKWELSGSQQEIVRQIGLRQDSEMQMIKTHHTREMAVYISTVRKELKVPSGIAIGLDAEKSPMFIRKLTADETKKLQNGDQVPNG
jgi:hypothetical protein